jgi:outer membrane cobalamin receptor
VLLLLLLTAGGVYAQTDALPDTTELPELSLDELSRMKSRYKASPMEKSMSEAIEAASAKPLNVRKTPSVVSVITDEEIERSGAKDFIDVLRLIPGMELNVDVEGVVSVSFRGMWANEGNVALRIDGHEVNDLAYASMQFGNHYSLAHIRRIEVIRGPGSAIYGGCAEFAVISITTKRGSEINGVQATATGGEMNGTYARRNIELLAGGKKNNLEWSVGGMVARGNRSNKNYTDAEGNSYNMAGNARIENDLLNAAVQYKGLSARLIYDDYRTTNRDGDYTVLSKPYPLNFRTILTDIRHVRQWNKKLQTVIRLDKRQSQPWIFAGSPDPVDSNYGTYLFTGSRYRGRAAIFWEPDYRVTVNAGLEVYNDRALLEAGNVFRKDSTNAIGYMNYAPFGQVLIRSPFVNFIVGGRYDVSSAFGSAINPRLGLTKRWGIFNFKAMYGSSFRAPAIESIQSAITGNMLKPERAHTMELEASANLMKNMYLSVNLFDITAIDAIKYFVNTDPNTTNPYLDGYRNTPYNTGSRGIEAEYKYKSQHGSITAGYSMYTVQGKGVDEGNAVPGVRNTTLGTARHKMSLMASVNITTKVYASVSAFYLSKRYVYAATDVAGNGILSELPQQVLANVFVGANDLLKNCTVGIGVANLTDETILYPQAYNSLHAPLPGPGREVYVRLTYKIPHREKT